MNKPDVPAKALTAVLREAQELLSLEGNCFIWSRWKEASEAVAEVQQHISRLASGDYSQLCQLDLLFGATGAIQEVSVSSGWGDKFVVLAERFDKELATLKAKEPSK
ncbi:MAG TPA: hypothetical protein PK280_01350 [Planctomycetota bacterium]|nr:hypothetical protein [Planctomycetota bacterium]